ncbi:MAG: hydrogenase maturation protease [Candidatus Acidiferrales bacterium]
MNDRIDTTGCGKSLVIGYGNPLRGDDGVGWRVAATFEALQEELEIEVMTCQQLVPEFAERVSHAKTVYFVDAAHAGVPGEWTCRPVQADYATSAILHFATPGALLATAQKLYGTVPKAYLFTVCGASFDFGDELSAGVARAVPSVAAAIENHVMAAELESGLPELKGQDATRAHRLPRSVP